MSDGYIRRLNSHEVYRNDVVAMHDDEVEFASGRRGRHARLGWARPGSGVVLLPTFQGRIALVRTYRYPIGAWQWALPRGFAHGDDVLTSAREELREELGASASQLTVLGHLTPDSGLLSARVAVVHAVLTSSQLAPTDHDEVDQTRWVTVEQLTAAVAEGGIEDGFTVAAFGLAHATGLFSAPSSNGGQGTPRLPTPM